MHSQANYPMLYRISPEWGFVAIVEHLIKAMALRSGRNSNSRRSEHTCPQICFSQRHRLFQQHLRPPDQLHRKSCIDGCRLPGKLAQNVSQEFAVSVNERSRCLQPRPHHDLKSQEMSLEHKQGQPLRGVEVLELLG